MNPIEIKSQNNTKICIKQHQAHTEKGFQIRKQICQITKEGCRIQLQKSAQNSQKERVYPGRGGQGTRGIYLKRPQFF